MTRSEWRQLPEREREAMRQASAEASLREFAPRRPRRRSEWERTMEIWEARDAYRVENGVIWFGILALLGFVLVCAGIFLR
jgi:hypothetical protein